MTPRRPGLARLLRQTGCYILDSGLTQCIRFLGTKLLLHWPLTAAILSNFQVLALTPGTPCL